jgi:hypothetical protein
MVKRIEHVTEGGVEKRWCGKCTVFKPLDRFGYSKSTWDNLRPTDDNIRKKDFFSPVQKTRYMKWFIETKIT